jgi:hypothetical protein
MKDLFRVNLALSFFLLLSQSFAKSAEEMDIEQPHEGAPAYYPQGVVVENEEQEITEEQKQKAKEAVERAKKRLGIKTKPTAHDTRK